MKISSLISATILALGLTASAVRADEPAPAPVAETPSVDHVIYLARLPAPADLVQGAEAQHAKIDRMDQSSDRVVVTYSYANGRSVTFAYTLLSSIGAQPPVALSASRQPVYGAPVAGTMPSNVTYAATQPSTVVYTQPSTVYYQQPSYQYYDPVWDFWAPVAVGVGLGWGLGWHGGWHGGWHSGWHGGSSHGWHR